MPRGGAPRETADDGPERRCIATGQSCPVHQLVRFVVGPGGDVVPDVAGKLPGRGIWVRATRHALDRAAARKLFARAARRPVTVPAGLTDTVEELLAQRVVSLLSLARKSGQAVAGFEKCRELARAEAMAVLIQAADGSPRGKTKLRPPDGPGAYIDWLRAQELGLAFGRDHVIHIALRAGGLQRRVVHDAQRLSGLRTDIGGYAAGKDKTNA